MSECLESWVGHKQCLWTFGQSLDDLGLPVVDGVRVLDANDLLERCEADYLMANGIPLHFVKDIMEMQCLFLIGGVFTDLDFVWVGIELPLHGGCIFAEEPNRKGVFERKYKAMCLGLVGLPCGSSLAKTLVTYVLK